LLSKTIVDLNNVVKNKGETEAMELLSVVVETKIKMFHQGLRRTIVDHFQKAAAATLSTMMDFTVAHLPLLRKPAADVTQDDLANITFESQHIGCDGGNDSVISESLVVANEKNIIDKLITAFHDEFASDWTCPGTTAAAAKIKGVDYRVLAFIPHLLIAAQAASRHSGQLCSVDFKDDFKLEDIKAVLEQLSEEGRVLDGLCKYAAAAGGDAWSCIALVATTLEKKFAQWAAANIIGKTDAALKGMLNALVLDSEGLRSLSDESAGADFNCSRTTASFLTQAQSALAVRFYRGFKKLRLARTVLPELKATAQLTGATVVYDDSDHYNKLLNLLGLLTALQSAYRQLKPGESRKHVASRFLTAMSNEGFELPPPLLMIIRMQSGLNAQ
jgi:hypothetical protein